MDSVETATAKMAEIPSEMNILGRQICRLREILSDLKTAITPILSERDIKPTGRDEEKEGAIKSELASGIKSNRVEIEKLIDFVDEIKQTVQL
jgi:hypothetical protein